MKKYIGTKTVSATPALRVDGRVRADSWVPSISDVFAEDWEIVK